MSSPFVGEIRMFGGNFAPVGWAFCEGQLLMISENDALFSLVGTIYGGDGQTTFALPDLRGRVPVHPSVDIRQGARGGAETVTLVVQQLPGHAHPFMANSGAATDTHPGNRLPAKAPLATTFPYGTDAPPTTLHPGSIAAVGGSQPHDNMQPYLCISFIISLFGVYPSRT